MIPKECKRLAEVDFPIAEVSRHSARDKSIRHGHPSTTPHLVGTSASGVIKGGPDGSPDARPVRP